MWLRRRWWSICCAAATVTVSHDLALTHRLGYSFNLHLFARRPTFVAVNRRARATCAPQTSPAQHPRGHTDGQWFVQIIPSSLYFMFLAKQLCRRMILPNSVDRTLGQSRLLGLLFKKYYNNSEREPWDFLLSLYFFMNNIHNDDETNDNTRSSGKCLSTRPFLMRMKLNFKILVHTLQNVFDRKPTSTSFDFTRESLLIKPIGIP